jgi:hypothetical protein
LVDETEEEVGFKYRKQAKQLADRRATSEFIELIKRR